MLTNRRHRFRWLGWAGVLLCGALVGAQAQDDEGYDPLAGVDANGRIPKVPFPDDIVHPQRWRYIPEGRIKPGSVIDRFLVSSFVAPLVVSEEDVGTGGGLTLTDIDFRNQRRREFAGLFASYTSKGQQRYAFVHQRWLHQRDLPGGGVIQEERGLQRSAIGYEKSLTRRFFGLGMESNEADETSYTDELVAIETVRRDTFFAPGSNWLWRVMLRGEWHRLGSGEVSDAGQTKAVFPGLYEQADSRGQLWVGGELAYDNRDSLHNPYSGWHIGLEQRTAIQEEGDIGGIVRLHASGVVAVPGLFHNGGDPDEVHPPTDVVAFGVQFWQSYGDLPFYALPSLGGPDTLRGYIRNRFTDRAAWHASTEYRFWVVPRGYTLWDNVRVERLGLALFYDIGAVMDRLDEEPFASIADAYGVSFRASLERGALFRLDVGFSEEDVGVNFGYGLSF